MQKSSENKLIVWNLLGQVHDICDMTKVTYFHPISQAHLQDRLHRGLHLQPERITNEQWIMLIFSRDNFPGKGETCWNLY